MGIIRKSLMISIIRVLLNLRMYLIRLNPSQPKLIRALSQQFTVIAEEEAPDVHPNEESMFITTSMRLLAKTAQKTNQLIGFKNSTGFRRKRWRS